MVRHGGGGIMLFPSSRLEYVMETHISSRRTTLNKQSGLWWKGLDQSVLTSQNGLVKT